MSTVDCVSQYIDNVTHPTYRNIPVLNAVHHRDDQDDASEQVLPIPSDALA